MYFMTYCRVNYARKDSFMFYGCYAQFQKTFLFFKLEWQAKQLHLLQVKYVLCWNFLVFDEVDVKVIYNVRIV
jgi:hypothetical protein